MSTRTPRGGAGRRRLLATAAAMAALRVSPGRAQAFPARPVRIVVAFPPGGAADIVARLLADHLRQAWGQPVVVENRAGAGGNIAGAEVARAEPDGHTLLITSQSIAVNRFLYARMPFDPAADVAPVSLAISVPNVMVVPATSPDRGVADFIARARANPGRLTFGSAGVGTSIHLAGELFKHRTGVNLVHVPYRGAAPAMNDLIAGRLDVMFDTLTVSASHLRAGTIRALGVTTRSRAAAIPDVPPIAETVPDFDVASWFAFFAPARTPAEIVARIARDMAAALRDPAVTGRLAELGAAAVGSTPEALGQAMRAEAEMWEPIIRQAGIRIEEG
ncbi:Bug family tripartite tricarboxylate transporter substrate binding protein [Caldovatus aquaticus]|uniref:Tripartite tricarboxylate transporter substrate binding protein n=1 Tax=Caldovatus aquaticus TaxID=2865671 RepID=A0ABS7EX73_9PROT|nr:tripartite tricarboxylate transporter substrate binding protein [Caldovatus aquaticus]MBW8267956.1 tripartite tricarboxylate transporter substrate binding protein [Caldovatus aquaticus]